MLNRKIINRTFKRKQINKEDTVISSTSGKTYASGAGGMGFKSRANQISPHAANDSPPLQP